MRSTGRRAWLAGVRRQQQQQQREWTGARVWMAGTMDLLTYDCGSALLPRRQAVAAVWPMGDRERVVVGLCGPDGSGKSTTAAYLATSWLFHRASFNRPAEKALMREGGSGGRECCDAWGLPAGVVRRWLRGGYSNNTHSLSVPDSTRPVVVVDIKDEDEARLVQDQLGGRVWRVDAAARMRANGFDCIADKHTDEQPAFVVDEVLNNNDSLADLYVRVDELLHFHPFF